MRHATPAQRSRSPLLRWGATTAAVLIALSISTPAQAGKRHSPDTPAPAPTPVVVAEGLDNPRQLSFARDGDLLVAEAGTGGAGPCLPGPEGTVCFGTTGAITRISDSGQRRVVTGLPSIAGAGGAQAIGPSDVLADRKGLTISIGLGANPEVRIANPALAMMGTIVKVRHGEPVVVADVAAFEATSNPVNDPDSNPVSLLRKRGGYIVADAGGNTIVRVGRHGRFSTIAQFADVSATLPPFTGAPVQAVPTSVAVGPDGAYYVSQLTGFPFEKGLAKIWRIGHDGSVSVYAEGLTNVTDLAFADDGTLYAVQLSTEGLLTGPVGSLVRIRKGAAPEVVVGGLFAPYGLALRDNWAYLTTGSVAPGGQVVKVRLPWSGRGGDWHGDHH